MRSIKFRVQTQEGKWKFYSLGDFACSTPMESEYKYDTWGQFTGLLDREGVEIYEGDIVSDHVGVGQVKYSEKHGAFRVCYGDGLAKWFFDYILRGERESIEVIGNIHQNQELLNQQ